MPQEGEQWRFFKSNVVFIWFQGRWQEMPPGSQSAEAKK
jgi:hypothetical protein